MSDHGFATFDRAVHLNTWLQREGFPGPRRPSKAGDEELFAHVDWSRTQAYAMGLNGIYLNLQGREHGGIVPEADKRMVLERLAARLAEFNSDDRRAGRRARLFPEEVFRGRNLRTRPTCCRASAAATGPPGRPRSARCRVTCLKTIRRPGSGTTAWRRTRFPGCSSAIVRSMRIRRTCGTSPPPSSVSLACRRPAG